MTTKRILDDPLSYSRFFEDFTRYTAADWTVTEVGVATQAIAAGPGGLLLLTNAAADDDSTFQQSAEVFKFVSGKAFQFVARFKVSDATDSDFVVGLQITDTSPLAVTDGIFFQKDDGDANLDFHVVKNSTATDQAAIHTMEDDTFVKLEAYYDGSGDDIDIYVDDVRVAGVALTNVPDDEDLALSFGIQNGEAVAKTMTIDYIGVVQER